MSPRQQNPRIALSSFPDMGVEAWAVFDESAEVYEVYVGDARCSEWIGCGDSIRECRQIVRENFAEMMA